MNNYLGSLLKIPKITKVVASNSVADLGWLGFIYTLAGDNFSKRTEVISAPIGEAFAFMIYKNRLAFDEATNYKNTK